MKAPRLDVAEKNSSHSFLPAHNRLMILSRSGEQGNEDRHDKILDNETSFDNFPFVIEQYRGEQGAGGSFQPAARLLLTSLLRTSGLWSALPPDELRDLTLLLTFLSPNGRVQPTLPELAGAMQASHAQTRARMLRLSRRVWRGLPLVVELNRQSGLDAYLPGRHILGSRQEQELPEATAQTVLTEPRAGREALIAHSRARYATPRAEVEADIARRMGWGAPAFEDDPPEVAEEKRVLYDKLSEQGMSKSQALDILSRFDLAVVRRQLEWMPHRAAKNPSRYLQAAIENNYEAPVSMRVRQEVLGEAEDIKASA